MAKARDLKQQQTNEKYSGGFTDISGKDGFYRPKIEIGRWSLGAQLFKNNFTKLIGLNLFMLIFFAPIVAIVVFRFNFFYGQIAYLPFAANVGLGVQPDPHMVALSEGLVFLADRRYYLFLPLAALWLGVGMSGGMYLMRNLAWGERVRVYKTFLLGIKRNALTVVLGTLVFSLIITSCLLGLSYNDYLAAANGNKWYFVVAKVLLIIAIVYSSVWYLTFVSMGVTYKSGFGALIKNSVLVTTVILPVNLFFAALSLAVMALLLLGSAFRLLAMLAVLLIGVSYFMLVWTVYSQWVFDKFINPNIKNKYVPTEEEEQAKKVRDKLAKEVEERGGGFITVGEGVMTELGEVTPLSEGTEMFRFGENFTRKDIKDSSDRKAEMLSERAAKNDDKKTVAAKKEDVTEKDESESEKGSDGSDNEK